MVKFCPSLIVICTLARENQWRHKNLCYIAKYLPVLCLRFSVTLNG